MRSANILMVCAWLASSVGTVAARAIRLPDGQALQKIDFDRHVHALLDRQGCNAGNCHGNRNGKGGFSLSLMSASAQSDFIEINRWHRRQLSIANPEQSLFLLKASGRVPHDGGARVFPGSWEYQLLHEWIAQGATRRIGHGQIRNIQILPQEVVFRVGDSRQLKVIAEFQDGSKEDITCFCDFRNPDAETVTVNRTGTIAAVKPGDVGIAVFYRGQARVVRARVAVTAAKGFVYPGVPEVNYLDREVFAQLRRLNMVPSDLCSDEQFLRRVTLDLIGTIPAPAEIRAFVANKDPHKRTKKIDELLAHPLHAAVLATRFCEMTGLHGVHQEIATDPRSKAVQMAHGWFRKRLHENMPYDRIVMGVLTATSKEGRGLQDWLKEKNWLDKAKTGFGSDYAQRSTLDMFWRDGAMVASVDPVFGDLGGSQRRNLKEADHSYLQEMAERTANAFLGVSLECARCHNHPLDGWTPADHRAFANILGQVRLETVPFTTKPQIVWDQTAMAREVFLADPPLQLPHPNGTAVKPRLLGGPEVDFKIDPRQTLACWLAAPDNPYFARHFVNMLWEHYFGVSLVESQNNYAAAFRSEPPPLLDKMAKDFIQGKFDIRRMERTILLSRTYQLSQVPNETNKHDRTHFARTVLRRVNARAATEILHAALETAEDYGPGVPGGLNANEVAHLSSAFIRAGYDDGYRERIGRVVHRFGRSELVSRCNNEPDLRSMLMLYGSSSLDMTKLLAKSKRIQVLAQAGKALDELIDETFLATVGRWPKASERKTATEYLQRELQKSRREAVENLFWALINCREFSMRL